MSDGPNTVYLKRDPATGEVVTAILGLPNLYWTELEVSFGVDEFATAKVTLVIDKDQLMALVEAGTRIPDSRPEPPNPRNTTAAFSPAR